MDEELESFVVTTPEIYFGEVAGRLTTIGAWLDACQNNDGVLELKTRIPTEQVQGFREWLEVATNGNGSFCEGV